MRYIDGETLERVLDFPSLADALTRWHQVPPPQVGRSLLQQDGEGETPDCFLNPPAWYPGSAMGVKVIAVLPANPGKAHGLPAIQALYPVFDGETGAPKAVIDGTALTYWKTAGDSALATRHLARGDATSLLMVGSGALAPYLARAHCGLPLKTSWCGTGPRKRPRPWQQACRKPELRPYRQATLKRHASRLRLCLAPPLPHRR